MNNYEYRRKDSNGDNRMIEPDNTMKTKYVIKKKIILGLIIERDEEYDVCEEHE